MNIKSKKGFTIIEVVLVLAIAGLIFLMVFIALPTMQRNQRDTQRRNDYAQLSAAMTGYSTNNNGKLPDNCEPSTATTSKTVCDNPAKYINDTGLDPDKNKYEVYVKTCGSGTGISNCGVSIEDGHDPRENGTIVYIVKNAKCDGGTLTYTKSGRAFAIYGELESGNGTYCQHSS